MVKKKIMQVDLTDFHEHKAALTKAAPQWRRIARVLGRVALILMATCFLGFLPDESFAKVTNVAEARQALWLCFGLGLTLLAVMGFFDARLTHKINTVREARSEPAFEYIKSNMPPYIALNESYKVARRSVYRQMFWSVVLTVVGILIFIKHM